MERRINTDNFERFIKEKSDEFKMIPSRRVWHSIYNDLHPSRKWPSVAVCLLLITSVLFIGYINNTSSTNTAATTKEKNNNNKSSLLATNNNTIDKNNTIVNTALNNQNTVALINNTSTQKDIAKPTISIKNSNTTIAKNKVEKNIADEEDILSAEKKQQRIAANKKAKIKITGTNPSEDAVAENFIDVDKETVEAVENNLSRLFAEAEKELSTKALPKQNIIKRKVVDLNEQKAFLEDFAMQNKAKRKPWRDRTSMEFYTTPSIGYRLMNPGIGYESAIAAANANPNTGTIMNHKVGLGLEAGVGITYSLAKNIRIKSGIQINVTSYGIKASELAHPVITTLILNDPSTGNAFVSSAATSVSNTTKSNNPATLRNQTYQVSIPIGAALKLSSNGNYDWYIGASLQPTFVIGGKANIISSDRQYYITDPSYIRKWNMNTAVEAYVNYKIGGINLQAGPQFRYQLLSTYTKKLSVSEKLYNIGFKIGISKNL